MNLRNHATLFVSVTINLLASNIGLVAHAAAAKNIVLVHGAFVDGSGWKPVYEILTKDGYNVSIVQPPLSGLEEDVASVARILKLQDGPTVLVGHSYGGAIITEAGVDSHVVALVYIAAHAPDVGETQTENGKRFPSAGRTAIHITEDGYAFLDASRFPAEFAADLPEPQAEFEAHAQGLTAAVAFSTPIKNAAWKTKPSWYMVAGSDHIINPELERMYAKRANSVITEVEGASHSVFASHPGEVAKLIEDAALQLKSE
jgi:pimeloyl-ACP methyl ester carboxylesterase